MDMHFPIPGEHMGLEDHEELGQVVLDYKVQGCMAPLEFQALEVQEAHEDLEPHEVHGVLVALKDLLGPVKKEKKKKGKNKANSDKRHTHHTKSTQSVMAEQCKVQLLCFYS